VSIGATEIGRFGMKEKNGVVIDQLIVTIDGKAVSTFDRPAIENLARRAKGEGDHQIWVLDSSGIRFSNDPQCIPSG